MPFISEMFECVAHPTLNPSPSRGGRRRAAAPVFIVSLPLAGRDQGWGMACLVT
jgi:hypothetical protein